MELQKKNGAIMRCRILCKLLCANHIQSKLNFEQAMNLSFMDSWNRFDRDISGEYRKLAKYIRTRDIGSLHTVIRISINIQESVLQSGIKGVYSVYTPPPPSRPRENINSQSDNPFPTKGFEISQQNKYFFALHCN